MFIYQKKKLSEINFWIIFVLKICLIVNFNQNLCGMAMPLAQENAYWKRAPVSKKTFLNKQEKKLDLVFRKDE